MIVLTTVILLILLILAVSYYAYRAAFYFSDKRTEEERHEIPDGEQYQKNQDLMKSLIQEMKDTPCEWVTIRSEDSKKLAARYYHVDDHRPLQIQFHGYRSDAVRDFCGGNKIAREMGMNVLSVDQRAHGKSEGHTLTFGVKERYDCLSWINYARERFGEDQPIILAGLSMGAATVLMASELELPDNVKGIIADCSYSSPKEIICKVGEYLNLPMKILYPFVVLGGILFGHFYLPASSPVEAVKKARIPILLIHGEDDHFVPCEMSKRIADVCASPVTLETFPEAGHGSSYMMDSKRYEEAIKKFVKKCLSKSD